MPKMVIIGCTNVLGRIDELRKSVQRLVIRTGAIAEFTLVGKFG